MAHREFEVSPGYLFGLPFKVASKAKVLVERFGDLKMEKYLGNDSVTSTEYTYRLSKCAKYADILCGVEGIQYFEVLRGWIKRSRA